MAPRTVAHPADCMNGLFFYIGLGVGLAAACGLRPFLPLLLAGALGSAGALGVTFPRATSTSCRPAGGSVVVAVVLVRAAYLLPAAASTRSASQADRSPPRSSRRRSAAGALLFAGTLAAHGDAWWPGWSAAPVAALGPARVRPGDPRRSRAPARPRRARSADRLPRRRLAAARGARRAAAPARLRRCSSCSPAAPARPARAGEKYAGLRILAPVSRAASKLVLCVIDAMAPAMLERAVAAGRRAGARGADRARALHPRLRRRVPVGDARVRRLDRHRRRPGRAPDPGHELVSPRGAPLRRVRLELPRRAALRDRPPADRHGLQHEPRAPLARTRRRCSRRSTTPTCAQPARPT